MKDFLVRHTHSSVDNSRLSFFLKKGRVCRHRQGDFLHGGHHRDDDVDDAF